ncbi:unnamed protein product [Phaeothamnion confervicola]
MRSLPLTLILQASLLATTAAEPALRSRCVLLWRGGGATERKPDEKKSLAADAAFALGRRLRRTPEFTRLQGQAARIKTELRSRTQMEVERATRRWLSDENLKAAFEQYWRIVNAAGDDSIVVGAIRDLCVQGKLGKWTADRLTSAVPPKVLAAMNTAVDVTVELTLDYTEHPANAYLSKREVMEQVTAFVGDLDRLLHQLVDSPAVFRRLVPREDRRAAAAALIRARAFPRAALPAVAAVLHGFDPREEPLVNGVTVVYASQGLSREVAAELLRVAENLLLGTPPQPRPQPPHAAQKLTKPNESQVEKEQEWRQQQLEAADAAGAMDGGAAAASGGAAAGTPAAAQGDAAEATSVQEAEAEAVPAMDKLFQNSTSVEELGRSAFDFYASLAMIAAEGKRRQHGRTGDGGVDAAGGEECGGDKGSIGADGSGGGDGGGGDGGGGWTGASASAAAAAGIRRNPGLPPESRRALRLARIARYAGLGRPPRKQSFLSSVRERLRWRLSPSVPYLWGGQFAIEAVPDAVGRRRPPQTLEEAVAVADEVEKDGIESGDGGHSEEIGTG